MNTRVVSAYGQLLLEARNDCGEFITLISTDRDQLICQIGDRFIIADAGDDLALALSLDANVDEILWADFDMLDLVERWSDHEKLHRMAEKGIYSPNVEMDLVLEIHEYFDDLALNGTDEEELYYE